jgi:hypothetical protein
MPICDPIITVVEHSDGGLMFVDAEASACKPQPVLCPVSYDGGATPCPFQLGRLTYDTAGSTVDVSAPGYEHVDVSGVAAGTLFSCIPPLLSPSHSSVKLIPLPPDAGSTADGSF